MISLGNRNVQVWKGLRYMARDYPNADNYYIKILEESKECIYILPGNIYRGYSGKKIINNTEIMNEPIYWDWEGFVTGNMADEVYEQYNISSHEIAQYQKIGEEGITKDILFTIINHYINRFPHCY